MLAPVDADGLVKAVGRASSASRSNGGPPKESEVVLRNATVTQFGALEFATYRGQQAVNAASTLDPGNEAVELAQRQLLVAPHLGLSPDESEAYALAGRGGAQAVLDSVSLGDLSTITLAARRSKVQVHLPVAVFEDAQAAHLACQPQRVCWCVVGSNAEKDQEPGPDLADHLRPGDHLCAGNSLHDGTQISKPRGRRVGPAPLPTPPARRA